MISRQRSKLFVDSAVQGALLRQLTVHWLLAALVMFLYVLIMQVFTSGERLPLSGHLAAIWSKYAIVLVVALTVFPVFVFDALRLSNRFAGPMVSFRDSLERLSRGEPIRPVNFRTNDFWQEMTKNLNAVANRMGLVAGDQNSEDSPTTA